MSDPRAVHQADQWAAGARNFAVAVAAFWRELGVQGVPGRDRVALTSAYISAILMRPSDPPKE